MRIIIYFFLGVLVLASCRPTRNLAYFSDLQEQQVYAEQIAKSSEPVIQPDDLLSITVTSLNPEANSLFNRGVLPAGTITNFSTDNRRTNIQDEGYLVDDEGYIDFPVVGRVKLGGLTKKESKDCLKALLQEYLKDPIVHIRYMNYRITVIGEVNRPSTFTIPSEKINILAALGMAGDMTAFGKRENVLVIREENGERKMTRLNLNNTEVLNSPYFYLQQNDVLYVEPDKARAVQASTNLRTITILSSLTSLAIIIVTRVL